MNPAVQHGTTHHESEKRDHKTLFNDLASGPEGLNGAEAKAVSHFQKAVLTIGDYLIYMSLGPVISRTEEVEE